MGAKAVAALALLIGAVLAACGWYLERLFRAEADYAGVGSFRITTRGLAWFGGRILVIFGIAACAVGAVLLFL